MPRIMQEVGQSGRDGEDEVMAETIDWSGLQAGLDVRTLTTIEAHTGGEPLRILTSPLEIPGATILERRRHLEEEMDWLRKALMWEPRGHSDMYGCILTPPVTEAADFGILFMHNEGYSTMCGHGVIAAVTALLEAGVVSHPDGDTDGVISVSLDTPAGLVRARGHLENGRVTHVAFANVPSFPFGMDLKVEIPGVGEVNFDIGFGGAYYAVLPSSRFDLPVTPGTTDELVRIAAKLKTAVNGTIPIHHPTDSDLSFLYGVIFTDRPEDPNHHSRNLCVFADGEVDRSPTGTGVSARLALLFARGEIGLGEEIAIESVLGSRSVFRGRVLETLLDAYDGAGAIIPEAIIPEVSGFAFVTGRSEFFLNPRDTLGQGFLVR